MKTDGIDDRWIGKTFDDFLFRPQQGAVQSRRKISLTSRLTERLSLELPILSANMDSVTGMAMAETMGPLAPVLDGTTGRPGPD